LAIKIINKTSFLFIDSIFKTSSHGFYQALNIMGFIEEVDTLISLLIIPMTNKSYESYNNIFILLKTLLENLKIKINYEKLIIVPDYETALRNNIIKNFPEAKLEGYYFHYIKNLWMYS